MIDENRSASERPQGYGRPRPAALSKMSLAALMDLGLSRRRIAEYANMSPEDVQALVRDYGLERGAEKRRAVAGAIKRRFI